MHQLVEVVIAKKGPNHVLHLLLSIVTVGIWLPVWAVLILIQFSRWNHRVVRKITR